MFGVCLCPEISLTCELAASEAQTRHSGCENNGGEDSGDSGCEDESRESEAVVRLPPYAEVAEEFSTLEAKARSSGMETCLFTLKRPGWHGSELMPVAKRANSRTSAVSLTLEVRHGRVRLLCSV